MANNERVHPVTGKSAGTEKPVEKPTTTTRAASTTNTKIDSRNPISRANIQKPQQSQPAQSSGITNIFQNNNGLTSREQGNRESTIKLLSGQTSKGGSLSAQLESAFDGGYKMSNDEIKQIGGYIDKTTNKKADVNYVDALVNDINTRNDYLTKAYADLDSAYKAGKVSYNDYITQYEDLEKQKGQLNENIARMDNYEYKYGMDYYNWLKDNTSEEEVKDFEAYVASYDDSYLESLANSYKATMVDFANRGFEAYAMVNSLINRDYDYNDPNHIHNQLDEVSDELRSYVSNGRNDGGIRGYSLQTISSLMPMINDAIIFTATGGVAGLSGGALTAFVGTATNIEMGMGSASETFQKRLAEGNNIDTAFWNGVAHGVITAAVEGFNMGNIGNAVSLLTGGAGNAVLGMGLLSLPQFGTMAVKMLEDAHGEGLEEIYETTLDFAVDSCTNLIGSALGLEQVSVETNPFQLSSWGGIGDSGLTDQYVMGALGAVLMGMPTNVKLTIDSAKKYNVSGAAREFIQNDLRNMFLSQGDMRSVEVCDATAQLIDQERMTYDQKTQVKGVLLQSDVAAPATSLDEVMNVLANAMKLDVSENYQTMQAGQEKVTQTLDMIQNEMSRRFGDKINLDTYLKSTPEVREASKNIANFANAIGADVIITDDFLRMKDGKVIQEKMKSNENGVAVHNNTIIINPFASDIVKNPEKIMQQVFSHEMTHTLEKTGKYADLEEAIHNAMGEDAWNKSYNDLMALYAKNGRELTDKGAKAEVVANYVGENLGNADFLQKIADYNESGFTRLYTKMKNLLSKDPRSKIAQAFFEAYNERLDMAMQKTAYTNVFGDLISANDCQFNIAQYNERGRDILVKYIDKQVKKGKLDKSEIDPNNKNSIINTLDWYRDQIMDMMNDPDNVFKHFSNWSLTSMSKDHDGYPQLTCVVDNGEYKMNIDFSTVCKKRKAIDNLFNRLAKEGALDGRPLTESNIAELRRLVKESQLEVSCSLCFVDSKRFKQGSWADTLVNGSEKKIDKDLVSLGIQDKTTKHIMGWNEFVDRLVGDRNKIGSFNFAERENFDQGDILTDDMVDPSGLKWLKKVVANTTAKSEHGKIARALLNYPELRKHMLLGDLYGSTAFGNIKRGEGFSKKAADALFKIVNGHQGVAKPKSPYMEVTNNNEIIKSKDRTFTAEGAKAVGGVRLQSFSDFMTNMIFDYMEVVAEMQSKGLTAHAYTKVKDFAEMFGMTGIKINLSIIPKATTMKSADFLKLSDEEKELVRDYAGLEKFTNEEVEELKTKPEIVDGKETGRTEYDALVQDRGLSLSRDGSCYTAYIFEDESFNWLDALELQSREGYDKNVGTICVGVSDEHIWKMMTDDNVKQIIPYHKSSLNRIVAEMMNIGAYRDYTNSQNTRVLKDGEWKSIHADDVKGKDFEFYSDKNGMIKKGYDAREVSKAYLEWCAEKSYLPKFDQFAFVEDPNGEWVRNEDGTYSKSEDGNLSINDNYYKVLIDFRSYDKNGDVAPQNSVGQKYPDNFMDMLKASLLDYEDTLNRQDAAMPDLVKKSKEALAETDMQHSISRETEKAYDEAVRNNDMETAQRLVDEAARRNGYDIKAYHGTNEEFTKFSNQKSGTNFNNYLRYGTGFYFAPTAEETKRYGKNVMSVFLSANRLLDAGKPVENEKAYQYLIDNGYHPGDAAYAMNYGDRFVNALYETLLDKYSQGGANAQVQSLLREFGYDGVVGFYGANNDKGEVVVFDPSQIKSADPVTYDDNGNVIPLSKRFDQSTDDLRYSISDTGDDSERHYNTRNKTIDDMMNAIFEEMSAEEQREFVKTGKFTTATAQEVEEDPDVQEEGLWVKEPEGDYIKIDDGYISNGKTVAWKDERIKGLVDAIESKNFSYFGNGYRNVYALNLSPHDFRALSMIFDPINDKVWHNEISHDPYYNNGEVDPSRLGGSDPGREISYQWIHARKDGNYSFKIESTEGNHRAIILDESGYSRMPVLLMTNVPLDNVLSLKGMEGVKSDNPNKKVFERGDYVEVKSSNLNELIEKFGSGAGADIQYSISDKSPAGGGPKKVTAEVVDGYGEKKKQQFRESNIEKSSVLNERQKERTRQMSADGYFRYMSVKNKAEIEFAKSRMEIDGVDKTFEDFMNDNNPSYKSAVKGEVLLQKLAADGDERWEDVAIKLADDSTILGQGLQAYAIMQNLTPQGQIVAVERNLKRMQAEMDERYGNKAPQLELNPKLLEELRNAQTQEDAEQARQKLLKDLYKQQPITITSMINTWRYLAMLGNLRTHVRNFLGNGVFMPAIGLKNAIGTVLEKAMGSKLKYRTKAIVSRVADRSLYEAGQKVYDEYKGLMEKDQKYEHSGFTEKTFLGKALNKAADFNTKALDFEDMLFSKDRFALSYASFLKANNLTPETIDPEMKIKATAYAWNESLKATYRDAYKFAAWLNRLETDKNLKGARFFKQAILPFVKTPFNIVRRGVEYSPIGVLKSIYDGATKVRNGTMDVNTWIDEMASGLSGTAIAGLGWLLARMGLFRTKDDDKDRKKYFDQDNGEQDYAIDLGNGTYTIDWMSPVIMPLAIGAELYNMTGNEFDQLGDIDDANTGLDLLLRIGANISDPIVETSMLSGLKDSLSSYSREGSAYFGDVITSAIASYIGQMFPTLGGQIARTIDDTRRTTSPNKGLIDKTWRQIRNKIPGLSKYNEPYINKQGQEEKTEDLGMDFVGRAFLNMISPGYYSSKDKDKYDEELYRLYDATGEIDVFPSSTSKSVTFDKETMKFTPEEYTEWHKTRWQFETQYVNQFLDSETYKNMDDAERVKTIDDIRDYAQKVAKKQFLESKGYVYTDDKELAKTDSKYVYDKEMTNISTVMDAGVDLYAYYDYIENAGTKQAEKVAYLEGMDLSQAQKEKLYGLSGYKTSYQAAYNKASKSSSSKKSSKSSSKKKSSGGSKNGVKKKSTFSVSKGGKLSTVKAVTPKKISVKPNSQKYLNAYQNIMNRGSKNVSSASSGTVTCPRCGNRVSSATGRCPICGARL